MVALAPMLALVSALAGGSAEIVARYDRAHRNLYLVVKGAAAVSLGLCVLALLAGSYWPWKLLPCAIFLIGAVYLFTGLRSYASRSGFGEAR